MNHRRVIGSILTLALLAGSVFVPLARAACAAPGPKAASCPSCSAAPLTGDASLSTDRSCCAAPPSLSDREPATTGSYRSDDAGLGGATLLSSPSALARETALEAHPFPARLPGSSPPLLRTTVLRI
ncbi:MAG: hypothetical protein ACM3PF_10675 [Bacteroidota bacterium]